MAKKKAPTKVTSITVPGCLTTGAGTFIIPSNVIVTGAGGASSTYINIPLHYQLSREQKIEKLLDLIASGAISEDNIRDYLGLPKYHQALKDDIEDLLK